MLITTEQLDLIASHASDNSLALLYTILQKVFGIYARGFLQPLELSSTVGKNKSKILFETLPFMCSRGIKFKGNFIERD